MSGRRLFLTGGSGFLGGALRRELSSHDGLEIVALDRSGTLASAAIQSPLTVVRGELTAPASYMRELGTCDCVVHLAAATGKASRDVHIRDTAVATEVLAGACRSAGVDRFLFISSIAAGFPDTRDYPYAEAKRRAEKAVASSGLRYCILRPTMILGDASPVLQSLEKLALLPVMVVPGSGAVLVQPVAVDDVARLIAAIVRSDRFESETFDIGGPETLSMESLLTRIRVARHGSPGRALHVPLRAMQVVLGAAERMGLRSILPATAGQLSSFGSDGTATSNPLPPALGAPATPVAHMLGGAQPAAADGAAMDAECGAFTRYLIGLDADDAVLASYRTALSTLPPLRASGEWEHALLRLARRGKRSLRAADAFAALFAKDSVLRKRLVMLLAILETRPPYSARIDEAPDGHPALVIARIAAHGASSLCYAVAGAVLLLPLRLVSASHEGRSQ